MKTPEKEREQVDLLIKFTIVIWIIIIFTGFLAMKCSAQETPKFGYYVWIRNNKTTTFEKFTEIDKAQDFIYGAMCKTDLYLIPIISDVLSKSIYFEQQTEQYYIYIEKMAVETDKKGKPKYKRLKLKK
jgi:hypothetical protein